jgi:hypothetical protein
MNPIFPPFFSGGGIVEVMKEVSISTASSLAPGAEWQGLYEAAMLELNTAELLDKIAIARAAIRRRSDELMHADCSNSGAERQQLADALANLETLERLELKSRHESGGQTRPNATLGGAL